MWRGKIKVIKVCVNVSLETSIKVWLEKKLIGIFKFCQNTVPKISVLIKKFSFLNF